MQKYCKIVDEATNLVNVGLGTDTAFYESIGFTFQEVEQNSDGTWYLAGFVPPPPVPTLEEIIKDYEARIQARLDDFARTLTYDGILSACTYATSKVEVYSIEGQYCVEARDATWAKAYELLNTLKPIAEAGGVTPSWEEIEAQLPPLAWPEGSRGYKGE